MKKRRRSSQQVQSLVLSAARDLFAERGFAGTTTREIADRAGVSETVLFRNYGTKERIFNEAVTQPIDDFMREYTQRWLEVPLAAGDPDEMIRTFVAGLYDLARANRQLLLAAPPHQIAHGAQVALERLEQMAAEVAAIHDYAYDPHVAIRATAAMVISVSVFSEQLFGSDSSADRERIVAELASVLTGGLKRTRDGVA